TRGRPHTGGQAVRTPKLPRKGTASVVISNEVLRSALFPEGLTQLRLRSVHVTLRLLAKQNGPESVALIIAGGKPFLRVGAVKVDTSRQHTEIPDEIHP